MIQNVWCSLRTRNIGHFYDMVKICIIIIKNVNIFTIHETIIEKVIAILPITYQNKTKISGKNWEFPVYL